MLGNIRMEFSIFEGITLMKLNRQNAVRAYIKWSAGKSSASIIISTTVAVIALTGCSSVGNSVNVLTGPPLVEVEQGKVLGSLDQGVRTFKAIPYAQPPVGKLRWHPPQPPEPWDGVRSAIEWGNVCQQAATTDDIGPGQRSEDCLTLNVYAPEVHSSKPLPVMVWIHGGGLTQGSSSSGVSDGSHIAQQGIVVVSINYRLGRFGYFAHPALTAESDHGQLANYGLLDQIAALQWVQTNITDFGGDPENVTVFGSSAGGQSVNMLMATKAARGLFHKAVSQSGLGRENPQKLKSAEKTGLAFAKRLGVDNSSENVLQALRLLSPEEILSNDVGDSNMAAMRGEIPIIDGTILESSILTTFENGQEAVVPYIVGATDFELAPMFTPPFLKLRIPDFESIPDSVKVVYSNSQDFSDRYLSDAIFVEPAMRLANLHAKHAPTYAYRFSIIPESLQSQLPGAPHSSEQIYVFGAFENSPWPMGPKDEELGQVVSTYWTSFAKTGKPSVEGQTDWPVYSSNQIMTFTGNGPVVSADPWQVKIDALTEAFNNDLLSTIVGEP